jgi:hypothetical protein
MKGIFPVSLACVLFLFQGSPVLAGRVVPITPDPVYAAFPAYRIDGHMEKISIIGSGPGSEELQSGLTKLFMERTEIRVVEPGNLQSVLAGKVIEYHTGIAPADAQALSRMFQIDHLLLFDVEMAPYSAYRFGGRDYALISLKIVNTMDGEVLFQASRNIGMRIDDPRKYGYTGNNEMDVPGLRYAAFASLAYELRYALGDVALGCSLGPGSNVVGQILVGSVGDRAGIQKGDAIVGINDTKISTEQDIVVLFNKKIIKQGDEITIKIEREGKVSERHVKFPIIPPRPGKKWDKEKGEGVEESPEEEPKTTNF